MASVAIFFFLASVALLPAQTYALSDRSLQLRGRSQYVHTGALNIDSAGGETCGDLINKGAYFAIKVGVGTPEKDTEQQTFELVADTGSDSVIVTSCLCVKKGFGCAKKDKCFLGMNHSSTFAVQMQPVNKTTNETAPMGISMTFGSGTVSSIIASDVIHAGGQKATLNDGLLLMIDRRELQISGEFQGILGLGPPETKNVSAAMKINTSAVQKPGRKVSVKGQAYTPKLFMKEAGVERYSLCFNDGGKAGAMRVNVPKFKKPLPTIGSFHWGLALHGISVGGKGVAGDSVICSQDNTKMEKGQKTPCGIIPDSGTTLLMGPEDHIRTMFGALCDDWDRCKKAQETGYLKNRSKSHAFQKLLYDCADWKTDEHGIDEAPSVFFDVGEKGNQQKLELTAWSYIVETSQEVYKHHTKYLFGIIPVDVPEPTGKFKKVCVPSMGVQNYNTKENGPVWIMGHPLFYGHTVSYSLGKDSEVASAKNSKLEMEFTEEKCGHCEDSKPSFLSSQNELRPASKGFARPMRTLDTAPHVPSRDLSLPL